MGELLSLEELLSAFKEEGMGLLVVGCQRHGIDLRKLVLHMKAEAFFSVYVVVSELEEMAFEDFTRFLSSQTLVKDQ